MGAYTGLNLPLWIQQAWNQGFSWSAACPEFVNESKGALSADGERGLVWGVNVLAPYIMVGLTAILHLSW